MKRAILPLTTWLMLTVAFAAQTDRTTEELARFEHEWASAVQRTDMAALRQIIADDYIGTTASGGIQNREEYLGDFTSGDRRTFTLTTDDLRIKVYGETAVMTHGGTATGEYKGTPTSGAYRWTHVAIRRGGRWQAVANHVTPLVGRE